MTSCKNVGNNLKRLREASGFSQRSIADFLNVDQSLVSKIEKGERGISAVMLDELASLFGVSAAAVANDSAGRPLACAFRCSDLSRDEMRAVCAVNKIALNLEFLSGLLKDEAHGR